MPSLAHELHLLVALMDRRADALLQRSGCELSYARFLVLLHVSEGDGMTQRDLSARLGTSEAAVSRMVAGLARDGYLDVGRGVGNRRSLSLTRTAVGPRSPRRGRPSVTASTGSCGAPAPTPTPSRDVASARDRRRALQEV